MFVNLCSSVAFALFVIALTILYFYFKHVYAYWQRRGVPQLKPTIPFGNFAKSFMQKLSMGELVDEMYGRAKEEPYIGIYAVYRPILIICNTSLIRDILIKDFQHFNDRGVYCDEKNDPLSAHFFSLAGTVVKKNRI